MGRMWAAYQMAIADFHAAKQKHQGLGVRAISLDAPRTAVLEGVMTTVQATRDSMIAGIQAACVDLGSAEEPAVRYFQRRLGEAAKIAPMEGIVTGCGV